jgi:DNA segregation ATPase FtsK/SpoIIIE, S-DNA-T family
VVIGLADDIARSMSAVSVRVAVVPGRSVIGIELPNARRETVYLRELLASEDYEKSGGKLPLALGKDIGGEPSMVDLAAHAASAGRRHHRVGQVGGGQRDDPVAALPPAPSTCRFIMIDPKMLELSVYDGIPHLLAPVVTEAVKKAVVALKLDGARDGGALPRDVAPGRAQHRGLQRARGGGAAQGRGADPPGADRLRSRDRRADLRGAAAST